ncbi:hypothetical protein HYU16_05530 [Candidatus Woesearchaeota archaeon]|nr:hypothetical protein [Candidatus Woesearchaeota archaeon]
MAKFVKEPLLTIYAEISKYRIWIIAVAALAVILMALGVHWKAILFFPPLFLMAAFSTFYKRIVRVPPAFELISLTTVAIGMTHGPWAGAIFGATAALAAEIINSGIDAFIIGYVFGRAVMGALAGVLAATSLATNLVLFGMALTILFNLMAQSLYLLQGDPEAKVKTIIYVVLNLSINWLLFTMFGSPLLSLLAK